MSNESVKRETESEHEHEHEHEHEIFVGDIREEWRQNQVLASEIMIKAGVNDVASFILEALDRRNGKAVAEFKPSDLVDLTLKDRKFFRITPGGGGFS
jgi:hypothetical protein